jgi:hypothetical protein
MTIDTGFGNPSLPKVDLEKKTIALWPLLSFQDSHKT